MSDATDLTGILRTIMRTMQGIAIPPATQRLGVATQSLKKQIMMPIRAAKITANVPGPTPKIRPL